MSDNWIVQNIQNALDTWNSKLADIWNLVTQTPETFKGGVPPLSMKNSISGTECRSFPRCSKEISPLSVSADR